VRTPSRRVQIDLEMGIIFKMTVAELEGTNLEESAVIDHAIKTLSQGATVRVNIPARIYRVYGRQLTVEGSDGSRLMVQLFDYKERLYQIEAKALPGQNVSDPKSDVVRSSALRLCRPAQARPLRSCGAGDPPPRPAPFPLLPPVSPTGRVASADATEARRSQKGKEP